MTEMKETTETTQTAQTTDTTETTNKEHAGVGHGRTTTNTIAINSTFFTSAPKRAPTQAQTHTHTHTHTYTHTHTHTHTQLHRASTYLATSLLHKHMECWTRW